MNARVGALRDLMTEERLDALLVGNFTQCQYLLEVYATIPPGEARGFALIERDAVTFVADPLSLYRLEGRLPEAVCTVEADGNAFVRNGYRFTKELKRLVKRHGTKKLGGFSALPEDAVPGRAKFRLLPDNPLLEMAETSTELEISLLERAAALADNVYDQIPSELRVGLTEIGLKARIEELLFEAGADAPAFGTLVSFGENTNQMHAVASTRTLQQGDLVMLDFGAKVDGMGSDLTRTFVFGKADREQRQLWRAVSDAQQLALEAVCEGRTAKKVAAVARNHLVQSGYGDFYCHSLGHQLGLLNGPTYLSVTCKRKLRAGMALTVEPGAYLPSGGVRIEDDVVVTEDGCRVLTRAPKQSER